MIRNAATLPFVVLLLLVGVLSAACGSDAPAEPRDLLLSPDDFPEIAVTVTSITEEQSLDGPSAQVELQAPGFTVLQSLLLFDSREEALAALDGIRADLVSRGETSPGEPRASGVFEHTLGREEAASIFFIEDRGLVRLTVTGSERRERLDSLSVAAKRKLAGL